MISPRDELIKRVATAVNDLRHDLIAAGVPDADLWQSMTVDTPPGQVVIVCAFDAPVKTINISTMTIAPGGDSEAERQASADKLFEYLEKQSPTRKKDK